MISSSNTGTSACTPVPVVGARGASEAATLGGSKTGSPLGAACVGSGRCQSRDFRRCCRRRWRHFVDQLSLSELFFDCFQSVAFQFDLTSGGDVFQLSQAGASRASSARSCSARCSRRDRLGLHSASLFLRRLALPRDPGPVLGDDGVDRLDETFRVAAERRVGMHRDRIDLADGTKIRRTRRAEGPACPRSGRARSACSVSAPRSAPGTCSQCWQRCLRLTGEPSLGPITATTASTSSSVRRMTCRKLVPAGIESISRNTFSSPNVSHSRSCKRPMK